MLVGESDAPVAFATNPAEQLDSQLILAVLGKVMLHQHAASGAKGQTVHASVLIRCLRDAILVDGRCRNRAADRGAADLAGRRKVLLEPRLADLQHPCNIVEPVARVVGGQKRREVEVEVEQVADRVSVPRRDSVR